METSPLALGIGFGIGSIIGGPTWPSRPRWLAVTLFLALVAGLIVAERVLPPRSPTGFFVSSTCVAGIVWSVLGVAWGAWVRATQRGKI